MPVPTLTEDGFLPSGVYECTLEEIEEAFAGRWGGSHRQWLWANLLRYLDYARSLRIFGEAYLDGSFTSAKPDPDDIDIALTLPSAAEFGARQQADPDFADEFLMATDKDYWRPRFGVHPLPHYQGSAGEHSSVEWFQGLEPEELAARSLPPDFRKGVLRITL